ncbi:MAG: hypothetical protein II291_02615 [Succinivibrio sp.]|nr:hypothetical protein [Succinivibrio sp.]
MKKKTKVANFKRDNELALNHLQDLRQRSLNDISVNTTDTDDKSTDLNRVKNRISDMNLFMYL